MKRKFVALTAVAVLSVSIMSQGMTVEAGLLNKDSKDKKISIDHSFDNSKIQERKEAIKSLGASERVVSKLDKLHFFDFDFSDMGKVDVSTVDKVKVILEDNNIDINIYINIITINK